MHGIQQVPCVTIIFQAEPDFFNPILLYKMNSITIIGIIIIAFFITPIWVLARSQSLGKRKLQKVIASLGQGYEIKIAEHESWSNKVIGLDREGSKAAFAILNNPENKVYIADLKQYSYCGVVKNLLGSGSKYENDAISSINLQFLVRTKGTENLSFPLYSDSVDSNLGNELLIAKQWADKFNGVIHKISA
jgi:hypothetical protein